MLASTRTANKKLVERQSRPPAFACFDILGYLSSFRMRVMRTLSDMLADAECWEGVVFFFENMGNYIINVTHGS
jgi:hypothetical protein